MEVRKSIIKFSGKSKDECHKGVKHVKGRTSLEAQPNCTERSVVKRRTTKIERPKSTRGAGIVLTEGKKTLTVESDTQLKSIIKY